MSLQRETPTKTPQKRRVKPLMLELHQIVHVILLMAKRIFKILTSAGDFYEFEQRLHELMQECGSKMLKYSLESADTRLMAQRDGNLAVVRKQERTIVTCFGEITFKRRLYRHKETKEYKYLLDEALGLAKNKRLSPRMQELAVELGITESFRKAAEIMSYIVPGVSPMIVWQEINEAGKNARKEAGTLKEAIYERGETPEGKQKAEKLHIEADGVNIKQQKSSRKNGEIKLITAYERKEKAKNGRQTLQNRYSTASIGKGEDVWEETFAKLAGIWDMSEIKETELGGDGAAWIKRGINELPNTRYHLDKFHLRKHLTEALSHDYDSYGRVVEAIRQRDWQAVEDTLKKAQMNCRGSRKKKIQWFKKYLLENWSGITVDPASCSLGTIEGQVRHTIAFRMKGNGQQWTRSGAENMCKLLSAKSNGEIKKFTRSCSAVKTEVFQKALGDTAVSLSGVGDSIEKTSEWVSKKMPSLDTPYPIHYILRSIMDAAPRAI